MSLRFVERVRRAHFSRMVLACVMGLAAAAVDGQSSNKDPGVKDLSGYWELIASSSYVRGKAPYISGSLLIKAEGDEVNIRRVLEDVQGAVEREFVYFADGRGEINFWTIGDGSVTLERKSTSKWKKGKLLVNWSQKSNMGWYKVEEVYTLSKDGRTITFSFIPQMVRAGFTRPADAVERLTFTKKW